MKSRDKLRKALRGGFGYKEQRAAWDAVLPDWPWLMRSVLGTLGSRTRRYRLTDADRRRLAAHSEALRADDRFLARAWSAFLSQTQARRMHAWEVRNNRVSTYGKYGWGWFPD